MPGASLDQVIAAVNQNSARIRNLQTDNARITVPGMMGIPVLTGKIRAMRPGRLHLQASTSLTGPEVDLGANDELMWFWVRQGEPKAVYFARHDEFTGSAAQAAMPIEPQWLLDALGFAEFKPTDHHDGPLPRGNDVFEIRSVVHGPSSQLTKTTVVNAKTAVVLEQHIYAPDGRILASAIARSHRFYPEVGASLPQKVEVSMPAAELSLTVDVGDVQINTLIDNPQLWALPAMPGYPQVNLGGAPAGAAGTLGGQLGRADWSQPAPMGGVAELPAIAPPALPGPPSGAAVATNSPPMGTTAPQGAAPFAGPPLSAGVPGRLAPQTAVSHAEQPHEAAGTAAYPVAAQGLPATGVPSPTIR
ncbi:MAG: hypothetical protein CMJ58_13810 [Planctomycetaceae bacterium]|nr:hypothetical protein [Planctomycetaceae bacterium]